MYVRGRCVPCTLPSGNIFCTQGEYFTISNSILNFNFLAPVLSEILEGSQNYIREHSAPWMPLAKKNYTQREYFVISNCVFNFNFLALVVPRY